MSNNTITSSITDTEIWVSNTIFYMIGGTLAAVTNFLVFYTILCDKNLRTSSFFIEMSAFSLNRCLAALQCVILSIYRTLKLVDLAPSILDRMACYGVLFNLLHFPMVDMAFLCIMAINRSIAIGKPLFYNKLTPRVIVIGMSMVYVAFFLLNHLPLYLLILPPNVHCIGVTSIYPLWLYRSNKLISLILSFCTVALYLILIFFILSTYVKRRRVAAASNGDEPILDAITRKQLELLKPLTILVGSTLIFVMSTRILFFFSSFSNTNTVRLIFYGGALANVDFNVTWLALLSRSSDFRKAFKKKFGKK